MKYFKILACLAIFVFINKTYTQNKRNFTKYFTTSNGISGKVYLSTKPVTFSAPYVVIQADKIIVTSVSTSAGTIRGKELADFGISLPFECANGGFYVSGSVHWSAYGSLGYDSGTFKTGGRVTLGSSMGNTNQEIKLSQAALDRHRAGVKAGKGSLWEKTGSVLSVNISDVNGADFGMILNAVDKYTKRKADELALTNEIKKIERSLNLYPKNTSELEDNLKKYQQLASISDDSKYDEKMEQIRKRIDEITKKEALKDQNDKIADSETHKSNSTNTGNSKETTENSKNSSSSKRSKLDKIEKEEVTSNSDANYEARKFEMEQRFRDQKKLNNANYYTRNGDFLSAMVELNQVSGYNYREAQNEIKKIQYQALGQLSKQSIKRLEKYTRNVNFNGKDANEVLSEYSKKYNYVVSQFNESKSNVVDKTVSITAQRVGEKVGQGDNVGAVADGVMGIITATSAAKQANEARERAIRELKFKRDNNLRGLRDKLVNEYSSASNYYYGKALNSMNERNEIIALNNYNYYQCRLKTINEKFSYENGNWAKNGSCSIPKENKINSENTSYDNYEVSKRKFYLALEFPENSKERKDFLAAAELTLGKLPKSNTSDRKINDLTSALVLASNSKKLNELQDEVLSDFLLPMDSNNSAKINSLYRFLNFLKNPKKSVKENIPEFAYTTIDINSENIDWPELGNRYIINFENHVKPKLDALKSDLKNLKSLSEKELENLYNAKGFLDKNNVFNPKLNNYIRTLESNISSSNALDLAKKKIYNNVVVENFNSIKHEYVENEQKREYVIANMLEELPSIENENLVEKISYEVINDKKNSVGKLNGLEYTLLEKLSCLCDKNMLFDSLLKKSVGSLKKTREERVNLLLFMAQNYSAFNRCSQDEVKERFKLIASYGIEKLVDIREIHYKLRPKISNNQTIINRNGDKFLITKRIL